MTDVQQMDFRNPQVAASPQAAAMVGNLLEDEAAPPDLYPTTFDLPGGWVDAEGTVHREAEVRELTGADEEAIARTLVKGGDLAGINWINRVASLGLVGIDGHVLTQPEYDQLLIGDRDAIFLAIRNVTYGTDYETSIRCPVCQRDSDVVFELDKDIPTLEIDDAGQIWRRVELRRGQVGEVRLVNVSDQVAAFADASLTKEERYTILLARCLRSIDGQPILGETTARQLSAGNRKILMDYIIEHQPGPQLGEVVATCPKCNQDSNITLGMVAMFP